MIEGYSIRQLQSLSSIRSRKLRHIIHRCLQLPPLPYKSFLLPFCKHLILDGTFLHKRISIIALMNATGHSIISGQYDLSESSQKDLLQFLQPLKDLGLQPLSCTIDGNPQVARTLKILWPSIILQRCIVHVQRQGLMWCRQNPKRYDAKLLRNILLKITSIHSHSAKNQLLIQIQNWEQRYGLKLNLLLEKGWVLSDLKRARSMLLKALPNMFHYLDNPSIPTSTNGIEGYFARLKHRYRQHRGLAVTKRRLYFQHYFYLCPR